MQQQNLRLLSSSSPTFALYCHTTFSQTQTGATVPLIPLNCWRIIQQHYDTQLTYYVTFFRIFLLRSQTAAQNQQNVFKGTVS
jgi:hypothetical protein